MRIEELDNLSRKTKITLKEESKRILADKTNLKIYP